MTKSEIKLLCEADIKLQWWAMVLFAEISEIVANRPKCDESAYAVIQTKVDEFRNLIIQRSLEIAQDQMELKS